jgi:hypothetical protein
MIVMSISLVRVCKIVNTLKIKIINTEILMSMEFHMREKEFHKIGKEKIT